MSEEMILAKAIYKLMQGELKSADQVFDFLFDQNFFESKQAVDAYVKLIEDYFKIEKKKTERFVQQKILDYVANNKDKFKSPQEVFDYMSRIGWFMGDEDARMKFLHTAEQL
jgi:hypothetical protein